MPLSPEGFPETSAAEFSGTLAAGKSTMGRTHSFSRVRPSSSYLDPLLFRFRAGFHCQIVDVVGRSHARRNQGAAAVLAPEKTPVFSSPAVSSLRASSPLKKLQFALNGHGPPSCVKSASRI